MSRTGTRLLNCLQVNLNRHEFIQPLDRAESEFGLQVDSATPVDICGDIHNAYSFIGCVGMACRTFKDSSAYSRRTFSIEADHSRLAMSPRPLARDASHSMLWWFATPFVSHCWSG
jgi:hypothetical protein